MSLRYYEAMEQELRTPGVTPKKAKLSESLFKEEQEKLYFFVVGKSGEAKWFVVLQSHAFRNRPLKDILQNNIATYTVTLRELIVMQHWHN